MGFGCEVKATISYQPSPIAATVQILKLLFLAGSTKRNLPRECCERTNSCMLVGFMLDDDKIIVNGEIWSYGKNDLDRLFYIAKQKLKRTRQ